MQHTHIHTKISDFLNKLKINIEKNLKELTESEHNLIEDEPTFLDENWLQSKVDDFINQQDQRYIFSPHAVAKQSSPVSVSRESTYPVTNSYKKGEYDALLTFVEEKCHLVIELKLVSKGRLFPSKDEAKTFTENDIRNPTARTKKDSARVFNYKSIYAEDKKTVCLIRKNSVWTYNTTLGDLISFATKQARIYADGLYADPKSSFRGHDIYYCSIVVASSHIHISYIGKADGHTYELSRRIELDEKKIRQLQSIVTHRLSSPSVSRSGLGRTNLTHFMENEQMVNTGNGSYNPSKRAKKL